MILTYKASLVGYASLKVGYSQTLGRYMFSQLKTFTRITILTLITLSLLSCSKEVVKPEDRAVARWQALIERDWEKAYSFETPGYRKVYALGDFKKRFGMMLSWKSVKHLTTKIDKESNTAIINLEVVSLFEPEGGGDMLLPNVVSEKWIFKDDQWWHVYKKSSLAN